jgi:hypothetical protein
MAIVLIVSKTQMRNGVCIGGIIESDSELIRIHDEHGANLKSDTLYEIGDRWNLNVQTAWNARPIPHTEDKQTSPINKIENVGAQGIAKYVREHAYSLGNRLTKGSIKDAFEGCLKFLGTRNFVNRDNIPSFSTQFWIADRDLIHVVSYDKHYYIYDNIRIKFVGYQMPINRIPAGTIIRLSLANWWDGDGSGEDRCYLQLSGWYI